MQNKFFQQVLETLEEMGSLPAVARHSQMPEESKVLSKLMEFGVPPNVLTQVLAKVFHLEVYDPNQHGEFDVLSEEQDWGVAGSTFFVSNPFERGLHPVAVLSAEAVANIHKFALLPADFPGLERSMYKEYVAAEQQVREWITTAYRRGASDIHIAPLNANYIWVRMRTDGKLQLLDEIQSAPSQVEKSYRYISNVLMRLAGLETGIFVKPADGGFHLNVANESIEVRLCMRPVTVQRQLSQAFYLRLFGSQKAHKLKRINALSLSARVEEMFAEIRQLNQNLVLITGPTGSGKSTTLYANLREMLYETPGRSIQTLEDPVECHIDGIEQTEINERAGMSFDTGLRAMMRSDVDVILVGEVRDAETAKLAVRASLSGHLVFATVHTKSALSAIERFADFGVSRKMLSSVLAGVFAQRLVRKACTACHGKGQCQQCHDGYSGRCPVAEFIKIDSVLSSAIAQDYSSRQLEDLVRQQGNSTLWDNAHHLIGSGITTLNECQSQLPPQSTDSTKESQLSVVN